MWPNPQKSADLVTFTEKILNRKLHFLCSVKCRSRRLQMFFKIGVFEKSTIFTGKHLHWSLFLIKLQAWRPATLVKRLQHMCFSVNIAKFLRTVFYRIPPVTASGQADWLLRQFVSDSRGATSNCTTEYMQFTCTNVSKSGTLREFSLVL